MSGELAQINDHTVLAQYGPMRLTVQAWRGEAAALDLALAAGRFSFSVLERLAPAREIFRREHEPENGWTADFDEPLLNRMVEAAAKSGRKDLGPMATVAGTVAEAVAAELESAGASRGIVENGGDLAIFLSPADTVSVGVRLGVARAAPEYRLPLSGGLGARWGVCSSGVGGRSLTRGVADTALVVARSAPVADAVATALGNACDVDSPAVRRAPAEALRPDTDIGGLTVTESVGELSRAEVEEALANAIAYANGLTASGTILGALVGLRGELRVTDGFADLAGPLEKL